MMEKLTYKTYCENPEIREQIDQEVAELRREAVRNYIGRPIVALFDHTIDLVRSAFTLSGWKSV